MMLSLSAVGVFFKLFYDPTLGFISRFISLFTHATRSSFCRRPRARRSPIVVADAWMWSPFVMLLVLAGLVSVPKYLYEAAEIDRAGPWRRFRTITFPYIRSLLLLALLFRTIETFKIFDIVYLLTEGGPGSSTETVSVYVYPPRVPVLPHQPGFGARLHHAVRGDRADEPLPLRHPDPPVGGCDMSESREIRAIGQAGWRRTLGAANRQPDLFLSRLFHPHDRLQDAARRAGDADQVLLFADIREFLFRVLARRHPGRRDDQFRLQPLFLQQPLHRRNQRVARADHWHRGRLRFLALSACAATTPICSSF